MPPSLPPPPTLSLRATFLEHSLLACNLQPQAHLHFLKPRTVLPSATFLKHSLSSLDILVTHLSQPCAHHAREQKVADHFQTITCDSVDFSKQLPCTANGPLAISCKTLAWQSHFSQPLCHTLSTSHSPARNREVLLSESGARDGRSHRE